MHNHEITKDEIQVLFIMCRQKEKYNSSGKKKVLEIFFEKITRMLETQRITNDRSIILVESLCEIHFALMESYIPQKLWIYLLQTLFPYPNRYEYYNAMIKNINTTCQQNELLGKCIKILPENTNHNAIKHLIKSGLENSHASYQLWNEIFEILYPDDFIQYQLKYHEAYLRALHRINIHKIIVDDDVENNIKEITRILGNKLKVGNTKSFFSQVGHLLSIVFGLTTFMIN